MKGKRLISMLLFCFAAAAMVFPGGSKESDHIKLRFAHMNAAGSTNDVIIKKFKDSLEQKTNGQVELQIFPAGQLGDEKEYVEGMQLGTVAMGMASTGYLSNLSPEIAVISFPYLFDDFNHVQKVYTGEIGKELSNLLLERKKLRIVVWTHSGFRDMITVKKPINSIADFAGMKFRSPGIPVYMKMFEAIGASPTPIPYTETYQAMKTGIVDGMETTPLGMLSSKIYEVGKYVIRTGHLYGGDTIIISDTVYKGLPAAIQSTITEVGLNLSPWIKEYMEGEAKSAYSELEKKGCKIIDIDKAPLREASKTVWKELSKDTPALLGLAERIVALQK